MIEIFAIVVLLFFAYSFIGWLWETIYCSLNAHHFVYRGFLLGPITPIYGFGILGVLYLVDPYQKNIFVLFFVSAILVSLLEYITSYLLEKLFSLSLWDYNDVPLNINGRVAVPVSIFWGICCVFIVKVVQPWMLDHALLAYQKYSIFLPVLLIAITSCDFGYTLANLASFTKAVKEINERMESKKQELGKEFSLFRQDTEKLSHLLFDETKREMPKLNFQEKRLFQSFPHMKFKKLKDASSTKDIKDILRYFNK